MYVSRVVITNMGPFGSVSVSDSDGYSFKGGRHEFKFKQGSVGIFGLNGTGKTSLVDLIFAGVTNDFGRIDKTRVDCVNNQAGPDEEASIAVELHHGDATVLVTRSIERPGRAASYELKISGHKVIKSAKEGDAELKKLGIDRKILDFCVFKRQPGSEANAIDDFLRTTPAARAEAYMSLNETEHCQLIYDTLGELLNHDASMRADVIDNSDELAAQLGQLEDTHTQYLTEKESLEGQLMKKEHRLKAEELHKKAERLPTIMSKLEHLKEALKEDQAELSEARVRQEKRKKRQEAADKKISELTPAAEEAKEALKQWERYEKRQARIKSLTDDLNSWKAKLSALVCPKHPGVTHSLEELQELRAAVASELDRAKKTVRIFEDTGLTACPTCGTEIDVFEGHLNEQKELLENGPEKIKDLDQRIKTLSEYKEAGRKYDNMLPIYEDKIAFYEKAISDLDEENMPSGPRESFEAIINEVVEAEDECETLSARLSESNKKIDRLEVSVEKTIEQINSVREEMSECSVDNALLDKARKRLAEHRKAELELAGLAGRISGIESQMSDRREQLNTLRARLKRSKKLRRSVKVVQRVRDAYHKQALPQKVAQANLNLMEGDINKNLSMFGDPFWIETDDNLSFQVHKPGEPAHRAEKLSGGQKVVLALSFWPAVNSLYKRSLGMMVLDEPTANLDDNNIAFLRKAMAKLTRQVRGRRQIIMISHADELKTSFDQVFELKRTT